MQKQTMFQLLLLLVGTFSDIMNSGFLQDIKLLQLFSDVASYNTMINVPEQAEMAVDSCLQDCSFKKGC